MKFEVPSTSISQAAIYFNIIVLHINNSSVYDSAEKSEFTGCPEAVEMKNWNQWIACISWETYVSRNVKLNTYTTSKDKKFITNDGYYVV